MATHTRDPKGYYSHRGQLYGPDRPKGFTVADLDRKAPLKAPEGSDASEREIVSRSLANPEPDAGEGEGAATGNLPDINETGRVTEEGAVESFEGSATDLGGAVAPATPAAARSRARRATAGGSKSSGSKAKGGRK